MRLSPSARPPRPWVAIIRAMLWDLFCRVIDNFGDMGVCW
ncbi:MAG: elongation factor P maturation arginine rhamnosyltransferase EarP, partial [Aquabacterium sp.]|nr:elongation factor P maturation arginine rhamnosyltransferase EarP [Aquabacterium sp.]